MNFNYGPWWLILAWSVAVAIGSSLVSGPSSITFGLFVGCLWGSWMMRYTLKQLNSKD